MKYIKVMLVDDEILAIQYIKSLIPWEQHGFEVVAHFTNPEKAIQVFEKLSPDIVIADIRMPVMDGLEFSKKILSMEASVKIILLTSYKDFEYAKQSVEVGIFSYLLKHELHAETLLVELNKIRRELELEVYKERYVRRQIINDILYGRNLNNNEPGMVLNYTKKMGKNFLFLLLDVDRPYPLPGYAGNIQIEAINNSIDSIMHSTNEFKFIEYVEINEHSCGILYSTQKNYMDYEVWSGLQNLCYEIQKSFKEKYDRTVTIVPSNIFNHISELKEIYKLAARTAKCRIFMGLEKVIRINEININCSNTKVDVGPVLKGLQEGVENLDCDGVFAGLDKLFNSIIKQPYDFEAFENTCGQLMDILNKFRSRQQTGPVQDVLMKEKKNGDMLYSAEEIEGWFQEMYVKVIKCAERSKQCKYSKKVQQVVNYIDEHYAEEISINTLADLFSMSGDYLRHIFKEETGFTILDFTTNVRIKKAKKLLGEGKYKIYEVADIVGYKSSQYFSQVFKKAVGINPLYYVGGGELQDEADD